MKNYNYRSYLKRVLVNGKVCYENGSPIENAIVFLEAFFPYIYHDKYYRFSIKYDKKYCGYAITNRKGEFCFPIHDTRYYYKIKVFNNTCTNMNSVNCCVNFD